MNFSPKFIGSFENGGGTNRTVAHFLLRMELISSFASMTFCCDCKLQIHNHMHGSLIKGLFIAKNIDARIENDWNY